MFDPRTRNRKRRRRQKISNFKVSIQFNWFLGFLTLLLWSLLVFVLLYVEPNLVKDIPLPGWYLPFFLLEFSVVLVTVRFVFNSWKRAILIATLVSIDLDLRLLRIGNWYSSIILVALWISIEFFWLGKWKDRSFVKKLSQQLNSS